MAGAALEALCRAGGWSYAAIWRSDRRDPRLLTIGECHCEDDAKKVFEKMVNQVHVVGEGVIGRSLITGECQWISDDTHFNLSQTSDADNLGLFQGYTWWQHQFSSGIKTIAVVPIPGIGVAQFGSMQKVSEGFLDQLKGTLVQSESISWFPSTEDILSYDTQFQLNSPSTTEPENNRFLVNTIAVDSLKNLVISSSNHSSSYSNGFTSYERCNALNPHIVAMPVNSKSINAVKVQNNTLGNALEIPFSKQPDSCLASASTTYSSLNNLPRIEHRLCTPQESRYGHRSEKPSGFLDSYPPFVSMDDELKRIPFNDGASFIQSSVIQEVGTTGSTSHACGLRELPNELWGQTAAEFIKPIMKRDNENSDFLESTPFDPVMHAWWDNTALQDAASSHFGATTTNCVTEQASSDPLSVDVDARGLYSESIFDELLGFGGTVSSADPLAGTVSGCQLPVYNVHDSFSVCKAQVPLLAVPSSSCTSGNVPNGASKAIPVLLGNLSVDDSCSLNTTNSKASQIVKPEGEKVTKKRARPGESMRPRPKDRQQIQERVKELREIVPNSAKCSIDALLDRTIKHMLFLQSVTKYAEKIKQADDPKMISKDSGAVLNDNSNGVVLKDDPSAGSNGGATWAYEVAGQTMVCPIIVEDLAPPGQMLVEMLCEERGFFLEIADTIRGFGLTILKGLMELRDGKIMARFLVEANKNVTRMDIFLSLVQLLQQNSLNRSSEQLSKVIQNGVPSFAEHQQSPISIPVSLAGR